MNTDNLKEFIFPLLLLLFYFFVSATKKKKKKQEPIARREEERVTVRRESSHSEIKPRLADSKVNSTMQKFVYHDHVIEAPKKNPSRAKKLLMQTGSIKKAILLKEILNRYDG